MWLTQLRYISALYYSVEALMVNEFQGSSMDCSGGMEPGLVGLAESAGQHLLSSEGCAEASNTATRRVRLCLCTQCAITSHHLAMLQGTTQQTFIMNPGQSLLSST
jgi:hypothetical protein